MHSRRQLALTEEVVPLRFVDAFDVVDEDGATLHAAVPARRCPWRLRLRAAVGAVALAAFLLLGMRRGLGAGAAVRTVREGQGRMAANEVKRSEAAPLAGEEVVQDDAPRDGGGSGGIGGFFWGVLGGIRSVFAHDSSTSTATTTTTPTTTTATTTRSHTSSTTTATGTSTMTTSSSETSTATATATSTTVTATGTRTSTSTTATGTTTRTATRSSTSSSRTRTTSRSTTTRTGTSSATTSGTALAAPIFEEEAERNRAAQSSLFCFLVLRLDTVELDLVRTALALRTSVFACDGNIVFGDRVFELVAALPREWGMQKVAGFGARVTPLRRPVFTRRAAGPMGHLYNADTFVTAWQQVREEGRYSLHDWTVKADPDTVFVPSRLREALPQVSKAGAAKPLYMWNCALSTHLNGALEVLSRGAVAELVVHGGLENCAATMNASALAEDGYLRQCMDILGVPAVERFDILLDSYCGGTPSPCNTLAVAFHPLKTPADIVDCFRDASLARP